MANVTEKSVMRMKLTAALPSHARTEVSVRDIGLTVDEPRERGGTNAGPSPTETLLAALLSCTNVIAHKVAEKNGLELKSLGLRLEAEFNFRGALLKEEVAVTRRLGSPRVKPHPPASRIPEKSLALRSLARAQA